MLVDTQTLLQLMGKVAAVSKFKIQNHNTANYIIKNRYNLIYKGDYMELYKIVLFGLVILSIVVGGYVFMFFHIMRTDPYEKKYRKQSGEDNSLLSNRNKIKEKNKNNKK